MLDDNIVALILIGDIELVQKVVGRLADHHGTEELASQPCTTSRRHTLLNEGNLRNGDS